MSVQLCLKSAYQLLTIVSNGANPNNTYQAIALLEQYFFPSGSNVLSTHEIQIFLLFWKFARVASLHHHHVMLPARISLTLSHHFSLSFIASGRSSGVYPVSSNSCCMYVWAGRPAFARPYVGIHRSTSLMSSSLLLQQSPACLVRLTWIVFVMGGR